MSGQRGFWDIEEHHALLSRMDDPLERLDEGVPWNVFRKPLARVLKRPDGSQGGHPPFELLMMSRIWVLQALQDLSDDQVEFVILPDLTNISRRMATLPWVSRLSIRWLWQLQSSVTMMTGKRSLGRRFINTE